MKVAFLGFDQYHGKRNIGSSLIRCDWPIKYWPEASRFKQGEKYDAVIFQKAYWIDYAEKYTGIKVLDLCDPDWLDMGARVIQMLTLCDAVTTSSLELAKYMSKITDKPVWYIPDRVDMADHKQKKKHVGRARSVVWFGYAQNFEAIDSAAKVLVDLDLELIVISNKPYHPPRALASKLDITNYAWGPDTVNDDILKADIVINPKLAGPRFKYKSNNKTLKSWALGMPVAESDRELKAFLTEGARKEEAAKRIKEVEEKWSVQESIKEWKQLLDELKKTNLGRVE